MRNMIKISFVSQRPAVKVKRRHAVSGDNMLLNIFSASRENIPAPRGIWGTLHYI